MSIPGSAHDAVLRGKLCGDMFVDDEVRFYFYMLLQEGLSWFGLPMTKLKLVLRKPNCKAFGCFAICRTTLWNIAAITLHTQFTI